MSYAQKSMQDIDFTLIPQRKICTYIEKQINNQVSFLEEVEATCKSVIDFNNYSFTESIYTIDEPLHDVWQKYISVSPSVSWDGKMISFGLLFSKKTDSILYRNENTYEGLDTSQVIYVNLRMMGGIYNLAVGFEITHIDTLNKQIQFSYIDGGKAKGIQTLQFTALNSGNTQLIHQTYFKSESNLRDKYFYPTYHRKAINEFHRNILHESIINEEFIKNNHTHKMADFEKPAI